MNTVEAINISSSVIRLILVPVFREFSAVLLAIAISKDCKARDNGSGVLWGLFTLFFPAFAGIIYCIYSRFLVKREVKTDKDKKKIKTSRRLTAWAILVYIVALVIAVIALITGAASGIASSIKNDGTNINSLMYDEYYDMNGVRYDEGEQVILYDKEGKAYHISESPNGWNYYAYFDEKGNEYLLDQCYISKDGYFYYDKNNELTDSEELYLYDKTFYDNKDIEYKSIGNYAFFDKDGKIVINHSASHTTVNEYAFE
ncbi:MAG: hypothetical protein ACI4IL_08365 [Eubacterium sp.]